MRRPIIAGNWKMNKTVEEALLFFNELKDLVGGVDDREIIVAPPFISLFSAFNVTKNSNIHLAAQNIYWEKKGAFTGEIAPAMIKDVGCGYVIIGHSERRQFFFENDEMVNKKIKSALEEGITSILCVGESLADREKKLTLSVVGTQISSGLKEVLAEDMEGIVVAYEPIWAIGTGMTASAEQAEEVHLHIRETLNQLYKKEVADSVRILYGGSVKPDNINELMAKPNIDGALVGGAGLDAKSFAKIVLFK